MNQNPEQPLINNQQQPQPYSQPGYNPQPGYDQQSYNPQQSGYQTPYQQDGYAPPQPQPGMGSSQPYQPQPYQAQPVQPAVVQPVQHTVVMSTNLGHSPCGMTCPKCQASIITSTRKEGGIFMW
eukprot:CAMPEP_0168536622 /NCGR_PEP_ID=MMETSP0405-20121227/19697_1 /TAXON_ID=498012 /ORGANISM="Trichosphaerium sp, Strain Am-I-7 wt" /LENGTH=123 /DNA_ID=CAMNT_0008564739 /DNA_START=29 /DNA_END=397 /DNA_ORIENTATION=+